MKKLIICVQLLLLTICIFAQSKEVELDNKMKFFVGYNLGQMAFNKLQNFAGELGMKPARADLAQHNP